MDFEIAYISPIEKIKNEPKNPCAIKKRSSRLYPKCKILNILLTSVGLSMEYPWRIHGVSME